MITPVSSTVYHILLIYLVWLFVIDVQRYLHFRMRVELRGLDLLLRVVGLEPEDRPQRQRS